MSKIITKEEAELRLINKCPDWKLVQYNGVKSPAIVMHTCGYTKEYSSFAGMMYSNPYCKLCDSDIRWTYNVGDIINDVIITNRKVVLDELEPTPPFG